MSSSAASSKPSGANESAEAAATKTSADREAALNIRRSFRSFASSLIVAARQAEKVAAAGGSGAGTSTTPNDKTAGGGNAKEPLEEAVDMMLRHRQSVRRTATFLEGKLRGNVRESEALHCAAASQPCVGGRKRKFAFTSNQGST